MSEGKVKVKGKVKGKSKSPYLHFPVVINPRSSTKATSKISASKTKKQRDELIRLVQQEFPPLLVHTPLEIDVGSDEQLDYPPSANFSPDAFKPTAAKSLTMDFDDALGLDSTRFDTMVASRKVSDVANQEWVEETFHYPKIIKLANEVISHLDDMLQTRAIDEYQNIILEWDIVSQRKKQGYSSIIYKSEFNNAYAKVIDLDDITHINLLNFIREVTLQRYAHSLTSKPEYFKTPEVFSWGIVEEDSIADDGVKLPFLSPTSPNAATLHRKYKLYFTMEAFNYLNVFQLQIDNAFNTNEGNLNPTIIARRLNTINMLLMDKHLAHDDWNKENILIGPREDIVIIDWGMANVLPDSDEKYTVTKFNVANFTNIEGWPKSLLSMYGGKRGKKTIKRRRRKTNKRKTRR